MLRNQIQAIIDRLINSFFKENSIEARIPYVVERPRDESHGDFATNAPFLIAPILQKSPSEIADRFVEELRNREEFEKVSRGGAGFVNFILSGKLWAEEVKEILESGSEYGSLDIGENQSVQVEFVSANPVGPMHVGHGRWAALGDSLSRVLEKTNHKVTREFYINDTGRQMEIFASSVACRYSELLGKEVAFPEEGYRGSYIYDIAREIISKYGDKFLKISLREREKKFREIAYRMVLEHLKEVLKRMEVKFDVWFSERSLHESGEIDATINILKENKYTYFEKGALWLKTSNFGDVKDRVLIRANGEPTYFAADIAYHMDKRERGFDRVIDIWGADHHGYVKRMKAAMKALGYKDSFLEIIIGQLVNLISKGKPVRMSKRTGEMVTLKELLDEVGKDALRFFFCSKTTDSSLDLDIELAKEESQRNPVYYVQYGHARINSILEYAKENDYDPDNLNTDMISMLNHPSEIDLMKNLSKYPEVIETCVEGRSVHYLTTYLQELASSFHSFYNKCRVVDKERDISVARLCLVKATKILLADGLNLLGVSAPEKM